MVPRGIKLKSKHLLKEDKGSTGPLANIKIRIFEDEMLLTRDRTPAGHEVEVCSWFLLELL